MNKACIIIPYYGRWPKYFNLFLDSIKGQPLDFLFVTDLDLPFSLPSNVHKLKLDFSELKSLFEQKLKSSVNINSAYKLCDYKPCYGKIFEDHLVKYDFWGFGDIDLIIGDIGKELYLDNCKWDVFSGRAFWVSGSLCILRNSEFLKNLYASSPTFENVTRNEKCIYFDECSNRFYEYKVNTNNPLFHEKKNNFTSLIFEAANRKVINITFRELYKESIPSQDFLTYSENGIVDKNGREYPLYHFITEKKNPFFFFPNWRTIPNRYKIEKSGFYKIGQTYRNTLFKLIRWFYGCIRFTHKLYLRGLGKFNLLIKQ